MQQGMRKMKEANRRGFGKFDVFTLCLFVIFAIQGATLFLFVHSTRIALLALFACVLVAALWATRRFLSFSVDDACRRVFPVVLIVLATAYALFFPPGVVPDGLYHFRTSYMYSNILSFQDRDVMRSTDAEQLVQDKLIYHTIDGARWELMDREFELFVSDSSPVHENWLTHSIRTIDDDLNSDSTLTNLPLPWLKIPSAIGIMIARFVGLGTVPMFYLGRIFNMLFAAMMVILAVRFTPIGRNVFMAISLMPMTLHLLGSYSYDAPIIGMALLLTALLLRAVRGEGSISKSLCAAIVLLAALLAPCKVVYIFINFIVLFVPSRRFSSRLAAMLFKASVILLPIVFIVLVRFATLAVYVSGGDTGGAAFSGTGETAYTLGGLLGNPVATYKLYANTFINYTTDYLVWMVGGSLGWLDASIALPTWAAFFLVFVLFGSSVRASDDGECLPVFQRVLLGVLFALALFATMLTLAIDNTSSASALIEGVQGRYLIPVIAMLLLAIRPKCVEVRANVGMPLMMLLGGTNLIYLAYIAFRALGG